jgi:deoxyribonuclease-4
MRLGIHTSISRGFSKAVQRLVRLECNACQIFSRSPRGGKARVLEERETSEFKQLCRQHQINPVVVHIPYVLNLATTDPEMHAYATRIVEEDLARAEALGAEYLVLHMGSHRGAGVEKGLAQVALALQKVLAGPPRKTVLLLENTSGAGSEVGYTFAHLAEVCVEVSRPDRVGVCFDTCHGWAAGYDLADSGAVDKTLREFDRVLGLAKLKLIHANDAIHPLGSRKDRHAGIGTGYIGEKGFQAIVTHPECRDLPFILETPAESDQDWERNIKILRKLAGG